MREPTREIANEAEESDDALVAAAKADRQAFAALYARYGTPIYRYCYHRLGNREAAEDATSLIFTKVLATLPRYRPAGSFRSWLFAIAHNTVADHFRHKRPTVPIYETEFLTATSDPEAAAIEGYEQAELHRLLSELPATQRRVMELRLSGLSSPEVARILGLNPTAVRSVQFRAVASLRTRLTNAFLPEEQPTDANP